MSSTPAQCPKCGSTNLRVPPRDAPDQKVECEACGATVGKRPDLDRDPQGQEEFVKEEVADAIDKGLPGSDAPHTRN